MGIDTREYFMKHTVFRQVAGMTAYEIEQMGIKYERARQTDQGIPVFGMMYALNESRKEIAEKLGVNTNTDLGDAKLDHLMKHENILSKRILNQMKLGLLIPKEEASDRVKTTFRAVINIIKVGIKHAATRIIAMTLLSPRDVETVLTEVWNDAIEELKKGSKVITWEEDGSANLLQTRLSDIAAQDPEFAEVLRARDHDKNK